jgi:hypothetical protein
MKIVAVLTIVLLIFRPALGCSFDSPMPFNEVVANAEHIAVVQIMSQELTDRREFGRPVVQGNIRILEVLEGAPVFNSLEFSNSVCGGVRLDVGHFYVLFTTETGPVLHLVPSDNSLIPLADEYIPDFPSQNYKNRFLKSVRKFVNGELSAEEIDPFPLIERNGTVSRVNCKPCMLLCPKNGA